VDLDHQGFKTREISQGRAFCGFDRSPLVKKRSFSFLSQEAIQFMVKIIEELQTVNVESTEIFNSDRLKDKV